MTNQQDDQADRMAQLGIAIRRMRQIQGLSLREFAAQHDLEFSSLHRLENGLTLNPSIFTVEKIANALGVTVDALMKFQMKECPTCKGSGWVTYERE